MAAGASVDHVAEVTAAVVAASAPIAATVKIVSTWYDAHRQGLSYSEHRRRQQAHTDGEAPVSTPDPAAPGAEAVDAQARGAVKELSERVASAVRELGATREEIAEYRGGLTEWRKSVDEALTRIEKVLTDIHVATPQHPIKEKA